MAQTDRHLIAHLLRRAGFGSNAADIDAYAALSYEDAVNSLVNYEQVDDTGVEDALQQMRSAAPASTNDKRPQYGNPQLEVATWLTRMLLSKRPLQEKMALFWHGHFVSSIVDVKSANLMAKQNALYRANALTQDFKVFTKEVSRDPAMLIYLNNNTNRKDAPNENWARELMELFTLGIGNYTETDVKEGARAFTGWTVTKEGNALFRANLHDSGQKTFLGVTGNLSGDDAVDIIFKQPAHPVFMARKLFRFFVYDDPDDATVNRFADIYTKSNFSIKELVKQILLSPEFRSTKAYYSLVKSPAEFTIGAMRALSAEIYDLKSWQGISAALAAMGQQIYAPPNVGGWPGNRTWVNTSAYYSRANLARELVSIDSDYTIDPTEIANAAGANTPQAAVDYFLELLLQTNVPADYRGTLLSYAGNFTDAKTTDGKLRGLVRLIMSTPVYQMN
ncbi:MAG: DUF1800 domain-containing protein [Chloroflexi bacterium]|nr:DUF1800 domain-containing protein [Chloroflexota bacterium]